MRCGVFQAQARAEFLSPKVTTSGGAPAWVNQREGQANEQLDLLTNNRAAACAFCRDRWADDQWREAFNACSADPLASSLTPHGQVVGQRRACAFGDAGRRCGSMDAAQPGTAHRQRSGQSATVAPQHAAITE